MKLILATTSKFKIKAFQNLGIPFETADSNVDEKKYPRDDPEKLVAELSFQKAKAVAEKYPESAVIGLDSIAYYDKHILEKPKSKEEAIMRLKQLSGNIHLALTGVCIICPNKEPIIKIVSTKVFMRDLSDHEIKNYVANDPDILHICLGYDPEIRFSASFVEKIEGSYHNLLCGTPLETIAELLKQCQLI
jgi:septum formation protein